MVQIKGFFLAAISAILSFFMPIEDFIIAMIFLFGLNFIFGLVADITNGKGWNKKKAEMFFIYCFIFFIIAVSMFVIGHFMHAYTEAVQGVKYLCVISLWFFSVNITRNWMSITPISSTFHNIAYFLNYILSIQFIERIPFMKEFIQEKEKQKKEQEQLYKIAEGKINDKDRRHDRTDIETDSEKD